MTHERPAQKTRTRPRAGGRALEASGAAPLVGLGYRAPIAEWTCAHVERFDVLEITIDHWLHGGPGQRREIDDLVGRIPLTAHGIGLSIGTDLPLDLAYLDQVAAIVDRLKAPAYSEHLAFTRVPGRDLANLLPLPRTEPVADKIIAKIRQIQSRIAVPFLLENIAYVFDWPDSTLSDAEFLNLICRETGAGLLLDIENLHLNSRNHHFSARAFLDALSPGLVQEIHMAGGIAVRDDGSGATFLADSHSHPVRDEALALLAYALKRHRPKTIILERDDRLDAGDEILADLARIRGLLAEPPEAATDDAANEPQLRLLDRQIDLLRYLTSAGAIAGEHGPLPPSLQGLDPVLLGFEARFSHDKRIEKIARVFPRALDLLGDDRAEILREFAEACPPASIDLLETARQFCGFVLDRWRSRPPRPAYLCDVVRCELALATARTRAEEELDRSPHAGIELRGNGHAPGAVRRRSSVGLLRCDHDVRTIFENSSAFVEPRRRDTPLVIAKLQAASEPEIFEVPATLFDLLEALDHWRERSLFDRTQGAEVLVADLVDRGILEVRA